MRQAGLSSGPLPTVPVSAASPHVLLLAADNPETQKQAGAVGASVLGGQSSSTRTSTAAMCLLVPGALHENPQTSLLWGTRSKPWACAQRGDCPQGRGCVRALGEGPTALHSVDEQETKVPARQRLAGGPAAGTSVQRPEEKSLNDPVIHAGDVTYRAGLGQVCPLWGRGPPPGSPRPADRLSASLSGAGPSSCTREP